MVRVAPTLEAVSVGGWAARVRRLLGLTKSVRPHARQTTSAEDARRPVIVSQMKGNAMPGGVQLGRLISVGVALPSKPPRGGRRADMGENRRERSDRKAKTNGTSGAGSVPTASMPRRHAAMSENSAAVASGYLTRLPVSTPSTADMTGRGAAGVTAGLRTMLNVRGRAGGYEKLSAVDARRAQARRRAAILCPTNKIEEVTLLHVLGRLLYIAVALVDARSARNGQPGKNMIPYPALSCK